jgi:hypothetical protein
MRQLLAFVTVPATALVLAAPGAADINLQRGIANVEVGMTQADVRATHGAPRRVSHGRNAFGRYTTFNYRKLHLVVTFQGNRDVTSVVTTSSRERTNGGTGVGSTERQVRLSLLHVHCRTDSGRRHCFIGRFLPGKRVTDFTIRRGRVTSVMVGIVLD